MGRLLAAIARTQIFRSIVRHGPPNTPRNRALLVFSNLFLHFHPPKARLRAMAFTRTFYLGGLSAGCFLILTITGVLLMFYYRPAVPQAYHDMKDLEHVVYTGMFLRNLHRWAAHAMVAFVFLHMLVVFYRAAYRTPREFNWAIGVFLFAVTIFGSYTGYLLPWDQLALWAVTVGTNMAQAAPLVGAKIKLLLVGDEVIGESALLRFYVLHCLVVLLALMVGIALHIWRIRKDGGIYLPPRAGGETAGDHREDEREPQASTYPHLLLREGVAFLALCVGLVLISLFVDAPLEQIANPEKTPNPAKAPWYFLGLQELLHYYSPAMAGVILPGLFLAALAAIPYARMNLELRPFGHSGRARALALLWAFVAGLTGLLMRVGAHPCWPMIGPLWAVALCMTAGRLWRPERTGFGGWLARRSLPFWIFTWSMVVLVVLTVVGVYFRGPGWRFTLPWRDGVFY